MNLSDIFIENIIVLTRQPLEESIIKHIRKSFLDYLGCAVAGSKMYYVQMQNFLYDGICSAGKCSVYGEKAQYSIKDAAFINGFYSHVLELDDGHRIATMHLAAPVFSAMVAVSQQENLSSEDFIRGSFVGYETAIRLACAMQPHHKKRGFHTTGTCGTVGVTMGVAVALHFNKRQMKSALSAAISSAAGVLEMLSDDSQLKPYNVGRAAMDGIQAAYVGKAEFEPPIDPLMGKRGFFATMTPEFNDYYLTDIKTDNLLCLGTFFKPYAACRHCHPAIEAAINLKNRYSIDTATISQVQVKTYDLAIVGHDHTQINGVNAAKMSIPYGVAIGLIEGQAGLGMFNKEYYERNDIRNLTEKVSVVEDPELSALIPNKRASIVEIKTSNHTYIERVDVAKGEPENPMTEDEINEKFTQLAISAGVSKDNALSVIKELSQNNFSLPSIIEKLTNGV